VAVEGRGGWEVCVWGEGCTETSEEEERWRWRWADLDVNDSLKWPVVEGWNPIYKSFVFWFNGEVNSGSSVLIP
jgi:hypothetical protein